MKHLKLSLLAIGASALFSTASLACPEGAHKDYKQCPKAQKMFSKIDANGDDSVSQEEFTNFHNSKFTAIDANGDGSIDEEEFQDHMSAMHEKRSEKNGKKHY